MPKITTELIRTLPRARQDIPDTDVKGFFIRCRPSGTHTYMARLGRGRAFTIGRVGSITPTRARAEALSVIGDWHDEKRDARKDGRRADSGRVVAKPAAAVPTLRDYVTKHYGPWVKAHNKTGAEAVARILAVFPTLLPLRLDAITSFHLERWRRARLEAGTQATTINRCLSDLRSCLRHAVKVDRVLKVHPMADMSPLKTDRLPVVRYLTPEEERRLIDALTARDDARREDRRSANAWRRERGYTEYPPMGTYTDHLHPLVLLALHTGLRRGELFGLEWRDIDLAGRLLTVRGSGTKSGQTRYVDLNATALHTLATWQADRTGVLGPDALVSPLVFPAASGARMDNTQSAWETVLKAAKVTQFRFHDLRHTFASKLVQAGVDLNTVRELLGHADLKMTLRYAHLSPGHRRAAVDRLVDGRG